MGGYAFGSYKEPCPNCGGKVKYAYFAGDHYDSSTFDIYCEKCEATFIRAIWEPYNEEKHGKDYMIEDVRAGIS